LHINGGQSRNPGSDTNNAAALGLLDWIANQVSFQATISGVQSVTSLAESKFGHPQAFHTHNFDLELFYIALARNLYDAGL